MTRMVETSQADANTNTTASTNTSTQNQTSNTSNPINANPFAQNTGANGNLLQGMLGNMMNNPNSILQMTSMILGDNDLDLNNLLQGVRNGTQTGSGQSALPNVNLNALLGNLLNPNAAGVGASSGATNTQQANTTQSSTQIIPDNTVEVNPYPVLNGPNESLSNLENLNKTWLGENNYSIPNASRLNYTRNILTSVGETLRSYYDNVDRFLPLVLRLAECLERESLVQSAEERCKVQSLIAAVNTGFENISKATGSLQPLLNGLQYGQNSGQGHLSLVTAIGTQVVIENNNGNNETQSRNINNSDNMATGNTTARSNPMQDMLSQLTQPDNMRAMMSMVGNLMGNNAGNASTSNQSDSNNRPNANPLNNLLNQLMSNMGGSMMVDNEVGGNVLEYFTNLLNDQNLKKTTILMDIPENILKINSNPDFSSFTRDILSQFSVQEIISLRSLNLRGFTRLRRVIREKVSNYLKDKFNNELEKLVKNISEIISQILIITENEEDKLINNNLNIERHIESFFTAAFKIILNENINDAEFELHLFNKLIKFIDDLLQDLISSYSTGREGALNYLDYNIEYLIEAIVGRDALNVLLSLDENIIGIIIDEVLITYESKKNSVIQDDFDADKMQVDSDNSQVI